MKRTLPTLCCLWLVSGACAAQAPYLESPALAYAEAMPLEFEEGSALMMSESPAAAMPRAKMAAASPEQASSSPGNAVPSPDGEVASDSSPVRRLMVYRGDYSVLVANVDESAQRLIQLAEEKGGYLEARSNGQVTVRVPAEYFFEVTASLGALGTVTGESLQALDVTRQFMDLSLRIETATKSRERLLELMKQATKMEDLLRIEAEVRRLTQEIESMKGELRLLSDQIRFSTLTVRFFANAPPPSPGPSRRESRFPWINRVGIERVLHDF